jgi:peptidyl-prolyl cis-trans isomerase D
VSAAFSDDVKLEGNNSVLLDIDGDRAMVLRVNKHYPERLLSFSEARSRVESQVIEKNQSVLAKSKGEGILRALLAGEVVDLAWKEKIGITRNDNSLPVDVLERLFSLKDPADNPVFAGVQSKAGDYFVIRLEAVEYADAKSLGAEELAQAANAIGSQSGMQEFQDFNLALKNAAKIEIN